MTNRKKYSSNGSRFENHQMDSPIEVNNIGRKLIVTPGQQNMIRYYASTVTKVGVIDKLPTNFNNVIVESIKEARLNYSR